MAAPCQSKEARRADNSPIAIQMDASRVPARFEKTMKWIDRAEARFGHLAISHLLHGIALLSAMSFILYKVNPHFFELLALDPRLVMEGQV